MMNEFQFDNGEITGNWECDECGYTYHSTIIERLQKCPQCGAPGESFSFWSDADDKSWEEPENEEIEEEEEEEEEYVDEYDEGDGEEYGEEDEEEAD
jgi:predicted  nucleic acid-binding Zn-ribbon protein